MSQQSRIPEVNEGTALFSGKGKGVKNGGDHFSDGTSSRSYNGQSGEGGHTGFNSGESSYSGSSNYSAASSNGNGYSGSSGYSRPRPGVNYSQQMCSDAGVKRSSSSTNFARSSGSSSNQENHNWIPSLPQFTQEQYQQILHMLSKGNEGNGLAMAAGSLKWSGEGH
ncbi:hypothetical protein K7X08_010961 [Anisodus acutangulus]|uniref:Uncharacterized protein n=1 Tax=Anisodus acutangulus TaxID=402998 RepID=A0A9Q1LXU7_9SOLA|nr:hypothetical protein K7X08_010961 [Anisodus acutangulus]